jgi:serine protease AprX
MTFHTCFAEQMNTNNTITCPLCNDPVNKLLYRFHIDSERRVIERIKEQHPGWLEEDGVCSRCVDYYHTEIVMEQRILPEIGPHFSIKSADDFIILPTGLRLNADPRFTGKGVTICFIDSGFYMHPDLTQHRNRIKYIADLTQDTKGITEQSQPGEQNDQSWHGTMTSIVCAGDGYMSNGLYKGIASDAELVLLKVQDQHGKITTKYIVAALQWVLEHHEKYGIRIVNMSLGDDTAISYSESAIDKLAEQLIACGITVVAAVGNDENGAIKPPANALNVIAVGGINDDNKLDHSWTAYHSSYGKTVDALMKPELLAHAIWIAAPILPGTEEQVEAVTLYNLVNTPDHELKNRLTETIHLTKLETTINNTTDINLVRQAIAERIQRSKYIAPHYMHVDGTSFAAPIVSSIIAQLLEINPQLTPASIRHILFATAKRISSIAAERQGFGAVQPAKALLQVLKKEDIIKTYTSPCVSKTKKSIEFIMHNDCASQVVLAGSFNHWSHEVLLMEPHKNGMWKIEIPLLPPGKYQYKFYIDDSRWMEDVDNPWRQPDGIAGFNSVLIVD